jgi:hypothetical protein
MDLLQNDRGAFLLYSSDGGTAGLAGAHELGRNRTEAAFRSEQYFSTSPACLATMPVASTGRAEAAPTEPTSGGSPTQESINVAELRPINSQLGNKHVDAYGRHPVEEFCFLSCSYEESGGGASPPRTRLWRADPC